MQDSLPPSNSAPSPGQRSSRLVWLLALLVIVLAAPYVAEQIQYRMAHARLRARTDHASEELAKLGDNAELVKLSDTSRVFRLVAAKIEPSVVHIDTVQLPAGVKGSGDELSQLYRQRQIPLMQGQGSGVIVDKDGYIVTNFHVIQGAGRVRVKLSDGRMIDQVKVIGADPLTDLAVLKVDADNLSVASWGDSEALEVGDWVLAVGNPYGLDRSVTSGIVSAKQRRRVGAGSAYQNFLQTDAAVNPGNSGGPLVNVQGEVVGITTAIVGRAFQGISFAIPSEDARAVYTTLLEDGKVARGWLGAQLGELDPTVAKKVGLEEGAGVIVEGVVRGSPADRAGLEAGDVILSFNGQPARELTELILAVGKAPIGSQVEMEIWRKGERGTLKVDITERPDTISLN